MYLSFDTPKGEHLLINTDKVLFSTGTRTEGIFRIFFETGDFTDVKSTFEEMCKSFRLGFIPSQFYEE